MINNNLYGDNIKYRIILLNKHWYLQDIITEKLLKNYFIRKR